MFGEGNALIVDYLLRTQGQTNPAVTREAPTADDIARVADTGLAPSGASSMSMTSTRTLSRRRCGLDFSFNMSLKDTGVGNFNLTLNASRMLEYSRSPSPGIQALLDARAAGKINIGTNIPESGSLLGIDGIPKWRGSASLIWSLGGFQLAASRSTPAPSLMTT